MHPQIIAGTCPVPQLSRPNGFLSTSFLIFHSGCCYTLKQIPDFRSVPTQDSFAHHCETVLVRAESDTQKVTSFLTKWSILFSRYHQSCWNEFSKAVMISPKLLHLPQFAGMPIQSGWIIQGQSSGVWANPKFVHLTMRWWRYLYPRAQRQTSTAKNCPGASNSYCSQSRISWESPTRD